MCDLGGDGPLLPTLWSKGNFNNKYVQLSNVFGTGAFSTVYHGSNICNSGDVAVKVINRSLLTNEEEERLVAEIEVLRELSQHPNVLCKFHSLSLFDDVCRCLRMLVKFLTHHTTSM